MCVFSAFFGGLDVWIITTFLLSMTLVTLEQVLLKACFLILCIATLLSWAQMAFCEPIPSFEVKPVSLFWTSTKTKHEKRLIGPLAKAALVFAHIGITGLLIVRWVRSGHIPLSNLYESSMCLAWSLTCLNLILQGRIHSVEEEGCKDFTKAVMFQRLNTTGSVDEREWLTAITAPSALLAYGFATLSLPKEMQQASALVPALQSNWLMMHVSMMMLSYGALLCGSLLAIALLVVDYEKHELKKQKGFFNFFEMQNPNLSYAKIQAEPLTLERECFHARQASLANQLDHWSYRTIGLGFPLLTVGILSGAVWANEAWGAYWSWDPKEVWALITWLVFAIYLHARMSNGWYGTKPAWIASLGLVIVWVCYLGVNLLGKGLHSYGWFH